MNIVVDDNKNVTISDEYKSKLTKITYSHINRDIKKLSDLYEVLDGMLEYYNQILGKNWSYVNTPNGLEDLIKDFNNSVDVLKNKIATVNINEMLKEFRDTKDPSKIIELIDDIYNVYEKHKKIIILKDLVQAKETVVENMRYYCSEDEISKFEQEFEQASKSRDVSTMRNMINKYNDDVRNEWKKNITDVSNLKRGDKFCFIGHSTSTTNYDGDFRTRYVSCSMFTGELTETYRSGFGFILLPENIVNAKGKDTYTNNSENSEEDLFMYTSITTIDHPKKIEHDTKNNQQTTDISTHYSEVVIDGFNPVGIFCFTDGSKGLNDNYVNAQKLKEKFPNLEIVEINLLDYKNGKEKNDIEFRLLERLFKKKNSNIDVNLKQYQMFNKFFEEYSQLISQQNYDENDILNLFNKHYDFIYGQITLDQLFSLNYDVETTKAILENNLFLPFSSFFNDNITLYSFEQLCYYSSDERINKLYPGISRISEIYEYVSLTPEMLEQINKIKPRTIDDITNVLIQELNNTRGNISSKISSDKQQYEALKSEYDILKERQKKHEINQSIINNKFYYKLFVDKYNREHHKYEVYEDENRIYTKQVEDLSQELNRLVEEKNKLKNSNINTPGIEKIDTEIEILKKSLEIYSKHPVLNKNKIEETRRKIFQLSANKQSEMIKGNSDRNSKLLEIEAQIEFIEMQLKNKKDKINSNVNAMNECVNEAKTAIEEINGIFGCDYREIPNMIKEAEYEEEMYTPAIEIRLYELESLLEKLSSNIEMNQSMLDSTRKVA